jgi:hypothetical protein
MPKNDTPSKADRPVDRRAAALRANLRRRKRQARGRAETARDEVQQQLLSTDDGPQ